MPFNHFVPAAVLFGVSACLSLLHSPSAQAFPPAPYYTLYGMVRDQVGQTITADGAVLLLLKNDTEVARTPVVTGARLDENYELKIRLDMARAGTLLYDNTAIGSNAIYSLAVLMDGQRYYPIETNGTLTTGKGSERVRLDLNLGVDSDRDGIPDVWEEWQLYQAGYSPNGSGVWPIHLISHDGDLDRDGLSDWVEYIAGTFAGDSTSTIQLTIKEKTPGQARLEFYSIAGKFYTIERTTDLVNWVRVPFRPGAVNEAAVEILQAADIGVLPVFVVPSTEQREFYRLTVR